MGKQLSYPNYIERSEEAQIRQALEAVRKDRRSRAVMLYGPGGVGKTSLVRHLAGSSTDMTTRWLEPIDADDADFWLLSNLESKITALLDPSGTYFTAYRSQLSQLPNYTSADISQETVVSHLGRIKEIFAMCYKDYIDAENMTVVITFDTIETIRDTNLLFTLTQWMKALPIGTLFILSGRPFSVHDEEAPDPIRAELENPHHSIPVTAVHIGQFALNDARSFVYNSQIADGLAENEKGKLILLTRGHPLWLVLAIDYLQEGGIPEEAERAPLDYIAHHVPYDGEMSLEGKKLHQEFLRRLVTPYRESDFWHEAIKRLAILRQPVARSVWQALMSDRRLPDGTATPDAAWEQLLDMPWVRSRGNRRYVTLHDAMAEELAQRLFSLHDQDKQWQHQVWRRALEIYSSLAAQAEDTLLPQIAALQENLRRFYAARVDDGAVSPAAEIEIIDGSVMIDAQKREIDQLKVDSWYYLLLSDFERGSQKLLEFFETAEREHDVFMQDLLALYIQWLLRDESPFGTINDITRAKLDEFRSWLSGEGREFHIAAGIALGRYLIDAGLAETALKFLDQLPLAAAEPKSRHDINILRGNACLRIPGRVRDGLNYFERALADARTYSSAGHHKLVAEAYKELGFYYRNIGNWYQADLAYKHAWDAISAFLSPESWNADRDEIASIQTNWAYIKGLAGSYHEGAELAECAIVIRRQSGHNAEEAASWSVCGEVYRYARRFEKAWSCYSNAEVLLQGSHDWAWLGQIYQEQAICLLQAAQDGVLLTADPIGDAKKCAKKALEICSGHSIRGYPSALNRAGRIFGYDDPEQGLLYLRWGISEARRLSDGWFWLANLIECVELNYRAWIDTARAEYRDDIDELAQEISAACDEYSFPHLIGRWRILQGHLTIHDYLASRNENVLSNALCYYESGFAYLIQGYSGSSGAALFPTQFRVFRGLFSQLPHAVRTDWQARLRTAWTNADYGESIILLVRLGELY